MLTPQEDSIPPSVTSKAHCDVSTLFSAPSHLVATHSVATLLSLPCLVVAPFWAARILLHRLNGLCCFLIQLLTLSSHLLFQGCSGEQIRHGLGYPSQLSCHLELVTGRLDFSGSRSYNSAGLD